MRQRGKGKVSVEECSYPDVDEPLHDVPKGPRINSIPPAAMAAAAAAAGLEGISTNSSIDSDDSSLAGNSLLGPATFGSSFTSDDDPYAWAQKLRRIPDKASKLYSLYSHWHAHLATTVVGSGTHKLCCMMRLCLHAHACLLFHPTSTCRQSHKCKARHKAAPNSLLLLAHVGMICVRCIDTVTYRMPCQS